MTMTDGGDAAPQPQAGPALSVLAQYVKDFSFENPSAPASLRAEGQSTMQIGINLAVAQHGGTEYEVTLKLEGKAERTGTVLFAFELSFAGMFRILNVRRCRCRTARANRADHDAFRLAARFGDARRQRRDRG